MASLRQQAEEQAQQLEHREAEVSALKTQQTTWRAVKDAEAASLAASNKQLTQQLAQELSRSKTSEGHMARLQAQLVGGLMCRNNKQPQAAQTIMLTAPTLRVALRDGSAQSSLGRAQHVC